MSFVSGKINDPKFENYISGIVALHLVGESLEPFTCKTLKSVHDTIKKALVAFPLCTKQCSEQIQNVKGWCKTCQHWKEKLEKFHRRPKQIEWKHTHSWLWPTDPYQMAEVFSGRNNPNPNLIDISCILTVWNNCCEFDEYLVRKSQSLRNYRNELFHNDTSISIEKRDKILQKAKDLLAETDIKDTLNNFEEISDVFHQLEQENIWFNKELVIQSFKELFENQDRKNRKLFMDIESRFEKSKEQAERNSKWLPASVCVLIIITGMFVFSCTALPAFNTFIGPGSEIEIGYQDRKDGCLQETNPRSVIKANFSMKEYLSPHNKRFYGRKWLFEEVEKQLLITHLSDHGTILIAEMGYGKTAFIANLLCDNSNSNGKTLQKYIGTYHLCRFESRLTRNVGLFIHRLASMLSVKLQNFTKFLNTDRTCLDNYNVRGECEADMLGCFDHCILFPLRHEHRERDAFFIVIIDALDECLDDITDKNRLADLLVKRGLQLPLWIRFLITSRNSSNLYHLSKIYSVMSLYSDDERNIQDIVELLKGYNKPITQFNTTKWNFQFHILNIAQNDTDLEIPLEFEHSFERYYIKQFERVFGDKYEIGKQILSVICASLDPLGRETIIDIVKNRNADLGNKVLNKEFDKINHFTNVLKGKVHLLHSSLMQWLVNDNSPFQIDLKQGHYDIALYYTEHFVLEKSVFDIVDLLIHISKSAYDHYLVDRYKHMNTTALLRQESLFRQPIYLRLSLYSNTRETVRLAHHHFQDIDATDLQGATALYKAASLGHMNSFGALLEAGANLNHRIPFPRMIDVDSAMEIIEHLQWDYGILDIAAMNGHENIVRYLLSNDSYDFNKRNAANLLPIHLACKFGHLEPVRLLHKRFSWMLDDSCLYYSAMEGYDDIVRYCLENGIADQCLPCNESLYWIKPNEVRLQSDLYTHESIVTMYDDWRLINCETALHAAVIGNKTNIVNLLLKKENNNTGCYDRGGKTPFMYAIHHGFEEIGSILMNDSQFDPFHSCQSMKPMKNTSLLSKVELSKLTSNNCPDGFSLLHMSNQFDRSWFTEKLSFLLKYYSDARDEHGCHPLHYAACQGSMAALKRFSKILNITTLKCSNGSTLIHSAAVCGSFESVKFLMSYLNPNVKDETGKTPAMYAVMREVQGQLAVNVEQIVNNTLVIFRKLFISMKTEDMFVSDDSQRTLLHYAVANGQFGVVNDLYDYLQHDIKHLVNRVDSNGLNPVSFAVRRMERTHSFHLNLTNILEVNCKENGEWKQLMSPVEYTILHLLWWHSNGVLYIKFDRRRILIECAKKNRFQLFVAVLRCTQPILSFSDEEHIFHQLTRYDSSGAMRFSYAVIRQLNYFEIKYYGDGKISIVVKDLRSVNLFKCTYKSNFSLIHYLALYFNDLHEILRRIFQSDKISYRLIIRLYFEHLQPKIFNKCYDSDGFNVLERAIQGGNKILVKHLLDKDFTSERLMCNLLFMAVIPDRFKERSNFTWTFEITEKIQLKVTVTKISGHSVFERMGMFGVKPQLVDPIVSHDQLIQFLINRFKTDIPRKCICSDDTIDLSLVHYFAVQNLRLSLKTATNIFGKFILNCRNSQLFTPLYFAKMFNSSKVTEFIENRQVQLEMPQLDAERFLVFVMQTRFYFNGGMYKKCFPTHLIGRFNFIIFRRVTMMIRCLKKFANDFGVDLKNERSMFLLRNMKAMCILFSNYRLLKDIRFLLPRAGFKRGVFVRKTAEKVILDLMPGETFEKLFFPRETKALMKRACEILNSTILFPLENVILELSDANSLKRYYIYQLLLFKDDLKNWSLEMSCQLILFEFFETPKCPIMSKIRGMYNLINEMKSFMLRTNYKLSSVPQFLYFYHEHSKKVILSSFVAKPFAYKYNLNNLRYTSRYIENFLLNYTSVQTISKVTSHIFGQLEKIKVDKIIGFSHQAQRKHTRNSFP